MPNKVRLGLIGLLLMAGFAAQAQQLRLPKRKSNALSGSAFVQRIAAADLSLVERERLIFNEVKRGNVPDFSRKLVRLTHQETLEGTAYTLHFYVVPDYMAIGSNADYFYVPTTPVLAQQLADLMRCSLPTKKMVDLIYTQAEIKLAPAPIPPTAAMTTVPVFNQHNLQVQQQLSAHYTAHQNGALTAGNKKDIIISNKIYTEKTPKVVIYGWHQLNGKAIQPVYNKHTNTWADYSHGLRFVQQKLWVNGKRTSVKKVLQQAVLHRLLSDEGLLEKPFYPILKY